MPPLTLTEDEMYAAILASDAGYNGRFVTGVLTTGIFCLPSCHARKPKRSNVRFFESFDEARAAGLRACQKCRPEEFERGEDRELESLEAAVSELRSHPASFAGVADLAERCGWGSTKLHDAVRRHYHSTPATLIASARVERAKALLADSEMPVTEIAFEVGFDSVSGFNTRFRESCGMSPSAYRSMGSSFELSLPADYNAGPLKARFARDAEGVIESWDGTVYRRALHIGKAPSVLEMTFGDSVRVSVGSDQPVEMSQAHAMSCRILGLDQDSAGFEGACDRGGHTRLVTNRRGVRIPQTPTVFDGVIWAVVGQQVNLTFARTLRRRLAESFGNEMGGMRALPFQNRLACVDADQLLPLQFSRRKAEYLIGLAGIDFESLRGQSATYIEQMLLAQRGLGIWSAHYLMMRALGFADCVPLGDTGLASGLKSYFNLGETPKTDRQRELMEPFSPYRSFATYHLWQSLKDSA